MVDSCKSTCSAISAKIRGFIALVFQGEGFLTSVEQVADSEVATTFDIEISITGLFSIIDETDGEVWNAAQDIWNQIDINWNEI